MTDDIDRLIRQVAPGDVAGLAGVEEGVWARISERRARARIGQVRLAAIAFALVIGIANGGLMLVAPRPGPSELRVFTVSAGLSPFAGLEARG
jgi:hypothetical protein